MSKPERTLFGTDGIRGAAGKYPLTASDVVRLGQAAAAVLLPLRPATSQWPIVVIGKDTRQSGDMLEAAMAAGLNSRGVDARLAGVIPTPAVARLTRDLDADFGIVISASHNPWQDNGIKFFGPDGYKLDDSVELAIEQAFLSGNLGTESSAIGRTAPLESATEHYVHFVTHGVEAGLLKGMKIALDAANGSACKTSPAILKALGAEVAVFHDQPSGLNINDHCGCTYPARIEQLVRETRAQVGISHDGDADRVLLCDEKGKALDGDELMAIASTALLREGSLAKNTLVTTVMSNLGLDHLIREAGGQVVRTQVGDRYVVEAMKSGGFNFGGEQSGHFVFRDINTTGDGIVAAVQFLSIMVATGKPLSELRKLLRRFPQAQESVKISRKPDLSTLAPVQQLVAETEKAFGGKGRLLLRYSGTEPLLRILIEGEDETYIRGQIARIKDAVQQSIGI